MGLMNYDKFRAKLDKIRARVTGNKADGRPWFACREHTDCLENAAMAIECGHPRRARRGKAVKIPLEWVGKTPHSQTIRDRKSIAAAAHSNGKVFTKKYRRRAGYGGLAHWTYYKTRRTQAQAREFEEQMSTVDD